jgi:hypothetical protein
MGARAVALYLRDAPQKRFVAPSGPLSPGFSGAGITGISGSRIEDVAHEDEIGQ